MEAFVMKLIANAVFFALLGAIAFLVRKRFSKKKTVDKDAESFEQYKARRDVEFAEEQRQMHT